MDLTQKNQNNSFASNGECGLKRLGQQRIGRQSRINSFASNGECGLKQVAIGDEFSAFDNSFASNGECGLKRHGLRLLSPPAKKFIRQ